MYKMNHNYGSLVKHRLAILSIILKNISNTMMVTITPQVVEQGLAEV
jgi:hypothetical protein